MEIYICECSYTFIVATGNLMPENVVGPIFPPDDVTGQYWMHKPRLMSAHEWDDNYADCSARWLRGKLS
jgi:hypothetical protein